MKLIRLQVREILKNTWYLNAGTINYGIDIDAWVKKGLGVSISIEQSRYLAEILPDIYGSTKPSLLTILHSKLDYFFKKSKKRRNLSEILLEFIYPNIISYHKAYQQPGIVFAWPGCLNLCPLASLICS